MGRKRGVIGIIIVVIVLRMDGGKGEGVMFLTIEMGGAIAMDVTIEDAQEVLDEPTYAVQESKLWGSEIGE